VGKGARRSGLPGSRNRTTNHRRETARAQTNEEELVNLTMAMAIIAINRANRVNIALRTVPGSYQKKIRAAK
jgi:alkylhydroperoxidase family enzyme